MTQTAPANYVWWLAGRSAGMVAMGLITCSVILGLAMASRVVPARRRGDAVRLHQHLALIALGAIAAHGMLLAADPWLKAGVKGIVVPFVIGYRPFWTGLGIVGAYLAAILGLSFYLRRRIGARLWRRMHRFTIVAYVLSLAHALGSGTDTSIPVVRYAMLASALPVLFLFALRLQQDGRGRPAASRTKLGVARSGADATASAAIGVTRQGAHPADRRAGGVSTAPQRGQMAPLASQSS
jgi:sulfoxide reductase heme-binding subunit YedZ